jgi:hypothetical protein
MCKKTLRELIRQIREHAELACGAAMRLHMHVAPPLPTLLQAAVQALLQSVYRAANIFPFVGRRLFDAFNIG